MNIDPNKLLEKIRINQALAQAKKVGAQVSPAVAATIRNAWKEKVPISVIRAALREMGVPMSPTMISKIAKSPTPRRKRGRSAQIGTSSDGEAIVVGQSAPVEEGASHSGAITLPSDHSSSNNTSTEKRPLAALTKANASDWRGPRS